MALLSPQQTGVGRTGGPLYTGSAPVVAPLCPVDPRGGTILSPDTDPNAVDPRQGTIIN